MPGRRLVAHSLAVVLGVHRGGQGGPLRGAVAIGMRAMLTPGVTSQRMQREIKGNFIETFLRL